MPKKSTKNASSEYILTPPTCKGQALAIMQIADAHRNLIDMLNAHLPSGPLRDRVMQAQQESFVFARLLIENDPKSFPDPKPVKIVEEPEEPFIGASDDTGDADVSDKE